MRKECRLCGFGGQGIILAGIILAEAAAIHEDKFVTQAQDYGPAARGDSSKTDVVISDSPIDFPECRRLDLLVALSQPAFDGNRSYLKEDGILIVDSTNVRLNGGGAVYEFPMTEIAHNRLKSPLSVNMVALGAVAKLGGVAKLESIKKSMLGRVPSHTKEQNLAALMAGYEIAGAGRRPGSGAKARKNK